MKATSECHFDIFQEKKKKKKKSSSGVWWLREDEIKKQIDENA